ncbi:DUF3854 domain-containing protein [Waterburya agarophytonicola K14]|uniref:DUF3854 domain-containing protein n=1 Tax=Waterburya agarophytonicola KI4 TaxID=2874699 RepID=A0A964FE82_9CYAN|nr:DUF3854 domain-containing protein [Waterburya agarophytonicola KI4]
MVLERHQQEWLNSAVSQSLIDLNVVSLKDFEPYDRLLYALPDSDRRNDGRIRDKILKRYTHIEEGGWWCSGVDVLTGFESEWGQFKPDIPYRYQEKSGKGFDTSQYKEKFIKYEPPKNVPTEIFALKVPLDLWQAIANRYDVSLPENIVVTAQGRALGFWAWIVAHSKIPIIITEGAKKAGAILTAEYVAIALPGIFNGYRQPKDQWNRKSGNAYLIPQLQIFAQGGRELIFCFDRDTKPSTVKNVRTAISKTGTLLQLQGSAVSIITWDRPEKGVDDLIAARGIEYFNSRYKKRESLSNFKLSALLDISKYQPLIINQRYLSENLIPTETAQLIGLKSPKNTGKTEWLSRIVRRLIFKGKPVLIITHRIQLAKALCARFGVDHIEEVRNSETRGILGYGLCIDSLHPNSQANFNPEDWSEAVVILDEAEQVIWHLLDSSTCQDNRVEIIENFQRLLKTVITSGGQIYLSDADLSAIALDYVSNLIGFPVHTWVAQNVYRSKVSRKLIPYTGSDPRDLIAALVKEIERGNKVFIQTTGQKAKSKWGSINLEILLTEKFPHLRIIRIDRDSVSEPGHPAVGCMANLDCILNGYDIAIASPVIETGVSINLKQHFSSVWAIAQGVQTVDAVCQTVERVRDDVPRHIWIKTTAKGNRIGNGSTSVKALLKSQHKLTKANILLLQQASISDFDDLEINFSPESLLGWGKRACIVNAGKNSYRDSILTKLLSEGYELSSHQEEDIENANVIRQEVFQVCEQNYLKFRYKVSDASIVTEKQLEELKNKKAKTEAERLSQRKGILSKRYGIEVTPELVEKDDNGWYPQLQLHYYLTLGNQHLPERDRKSLARIKEQGQGSAFKPDINKRTLSTQIMALQVIGIEQFLDNEAEFCKTSLADFLDRAIKMRFDIKTILGVTINPEKDSAIAVAQRILKKLGLKLEFKCWRGDRSSKQRVYKGCEVYLDRRSKVFEYWLSRETKEVETELKVA